MSELIPGSAALGMTNWQCIDLMESAEDTLGAITSSLAYLIHQESQNAKPDTALIAEWEALDDGEPAEFGKNRTLSHSRRFVIM